MPSSTAQSPPLVQAETLRQRILTKEGQSLAPGRGSLSQCALRFREFAQLSLITATNIDCGGTTNSSVVPGGEASNLSLLTSVKEDLARELQLHNLEMQKLALGARAAESEIAYYASLADGTQSSIAECRNEIDSLKTTLTHEKQVLKNREEYESLAKMAASRPSSRLSKQQLEEIRAEIEEIRSKEHKAETELGVKEKQFQLLMQSIYDLKSSLEEDASREKVESERMDPSIEKSVPMEIEENMKDL